MRKVRCSSSISAVVRVRVRVRVRVVFMSVVVTVWTEDYTVSLNPEVPRLTVRGTDDENVPRASVAGLAVALSQQKKKTALRTLYLLILRIRMRLGLGTSSSSNNIEESVELVGLENGIFEPPLELHPARPSASLHRFFNRHTMS